MTHADGQISHLLLYFMTHSNQNECDSSVLYFYIKFRL